MNPNWITTSGTWKNSNVESNSNFLTNSFSNVESPATQVSMGYDLLEKGQFQPALDIFQQSLLRINSSSNVPDSLDSLTKQQLISCVNYKILLQLLLKMKQSEQDRQKVGHFTRILVDLPLHSKHRLICFRMGINKNLQIQNFKFAARILQSLVPLNLQDKPQLEEKLALCESNHFQNQYQYSYFCPICKQTSDYLEPKCNSCNSKPRFCSKSFELIRDTFWECSTCNATYDSSIYTNGGTCDHCLYSTIVLKSADGSLLFSNSSDFFNTDDFSTVTAPQTTAADPFTSDPFAASEPFAAEDYSTTTQTSFTAPPSPMVQRDAPPKLTADARLPSFSSMPSPAPTNKKSKKPKKEKKTTETLSFVPPSSLDVNKIRKTARKAYKLHFKAADANKDGFVDGAEAKTYFITSGLTKPQLATIWKLADIDQDSKLNKEEFIIAMHYIMATLKGMSLPGAIPDSLVPKASPKPIKKELFSGPPIVKSSSSSSSSSSYSSSASLDINTIVHCIEYINLKGLAEKGLYRLSANSRELKELKSAFEKNSNVEISKYTSDVNTVAGLLKSLFRDLDSPIFPVQINNLIREFAIIKDKAERVDKIKHLIKTEISAGNQKILLLLFEHLNKVSLNSFINMMTPYNLSICWAPTLFRPSHSEDLGPTCEVLIQDFADVFNS